MCFDTALNAALKPVKVLIMCKEALKFVSERCR